MSESTVGKEPAAAEALGDWFWILPDAEAPELEFARPEFATAYFSQFTENSGTTDHSLARDAPSAYQIESWPNLESATDFSQGPADSLIIADRVRDRLPPPIVQNSSFWRCEDSDRRQLPFSIWIIRSTAAICELSPEPSRLLRWKRGREEFRSLAIVRDSKGVHRWFTWSGPDASFDLKSEYKSRRWTGLQFERNLNRFYSRT